MGISSSKEVEFGHQSTKVRQMADLISREISAGKYGGGMALPSINRLSKDYRISRDTVFKAFMELKERGIIDSTPGKGYYAVNRQKTILLLLDEYSPFKESLYNSIVRSLPASYKVDLWFHQYNERLFNTILRESIGKYSSYVIMNFDNEKFSPGLYSMDASRLLLLDFGKFDKKAYSYICQDFDDAFYGALLKLEERLRKYRRMVLLFSNTKHPASACDSFTRFCKERGMAFEVRRTDEAVRAVEGDVYIAIRQTDVVELVKSGREAGLCCGTDYGLIAYNDMPAYEVIGKGITSLSIDWERMGRLVADFVLSRHPVQTYLPTEIRMRGSV